MLIQAAADLAAKLLKFPDDEKEELRRFMIRTNSKEPCRMHVQTGFWTVPRRLNILCINSRALNADDDPDLRLHLV